MAKKESVSVKRITKKRKLGRHRKSENKRSRKKEYRGQGR